MEAPLNFAKIPFRNQRLPALFFGTLAGALLLVTLWHGVILTRYLMREAEELDVTVQGMEERRASLVADIARTRSALEAERSEAMSQRVAFLADVYRQKGFSWTELFTQLEAVIPPNVRITSISPSAAGDEIEVRLTTVGRSLEDLLTLVRNLEQSRFFGTVMPINEAQQEEEGTVSSTVTLRYHAEESAAPADEAAPERPRRRQRPRAQPAERGASPDEPAASVPDRLDQNGPDDATHDEAPLEDNKDDDGMEDDDAIEDNDA